MKKIYNVFKQFLTRLGYISNPVAYIENSTKTIEKIKCSSIFFIVINTKIHGSWITIEDRVDYYKSVGHRYLIYTITTKENDKILLKIKVKDGRVDISYDKILKSTNRDYGTLSGVTKFGGTIDIYDEYANKKLIRFLVRTLYKVNLYTAKK